MPAPRTDVPKCDVYGCSRDAVMSTDGTEIDSQGLDRPAVPNLNVCNHHANWPHSDDARTFALSSEVYRKRT